MKNKITHSLKFFINDLFTQVYNDDIIIPDAVNQITEIIENFNEYNNKSSVDPLFDYGDVPLLNHHKIINIKLSHHGSYKYFLYNNNQPDLSTWMFEDELLDLLKNKQKKVK